MILELGLGGDVFRRVVFIEQNFQKFLFRRVVRLFVAYIV